MKKIKYVCSAVKWFDKINGNTYHSVRVIRCKDGKQIVCNTPYTYGYGDSYRQTALSLMLDRGWIRKYDNDNIYRYERENNYPILWEVRDGLKRDMISNGSL